MANSHAVGNILKFGNKILVMFFDQGYKNKKVVIGHYGSV